MRTNTVREEILARVRSALNRHADSNAFAIPAEARLPSRVPGPPAAELDLFLTEVEKLGGRTRRLSGQEELAVALRDFVQAESIKKVTLWQTDDFRTWGIEQALRSLGIETVSPYASTREVAECELGITGADYVLPETGTLVLRSGADKPRAVSLLPVVHLAIIRSSSLRPDLHQVLDEIKEAGYAIFITGPSRTSDIELTPTMGVHGPKTLYVWVIP